MVNNLAFVQLVGVSPLFAFSQKFHAATEFSLLSFVVVCFSSIVNLLLFRWLLQPLGLEFMSLLVFVTVSSTAAATLTQLLHDRFPITVRRQGFSVLLLGSSSAVVGNSLIIATDLAPITTMLWYCLGAALGFALSLLAFAAIRHRTDTSDCPEPMRGAAIDLISAGLAAMCFLGFAGLV